MRMTEGLDEGPVLGSVSTRIDALDTTGSVHDRLSVSGAALMAQVMELVARGEGCPVAQVDDGATYARKIKSKEARIRWDRPAAAVDRQIRGLSPFPGAWFTAPSERGPVRVKALLSMVDHGKGQPGAILDNDLLIACGVGAVRILRAQREGKAPQDVEVFLRGFPLIRGQTAG
jgi:methionyl-tRNA formyltransferase